MPWECTTCRYLVSARDAVCAECGARSSRFLLDSKDGSHQAQKAAAAPTAHSWRRLLSTTFRIAVAIGILWISVALVVNISMNTGGACWLALAGLLILAFWRPLLGLPSPHGSKPATGTWIEDGTLFGIGTDSVECDFLDDDECVAIPLEAIDSIATAVAEASGVSRLTLTVTDNGPVTRRTRQWHHRGTVTIRFFAAPIEAAATEQVVRELIDEAQQLASGSPHDARALASTFAMRRCPRCFVPLGDAASCARCAIPLPMDALTVPLRWRMWPFRSHDLLIVTADSWFPRSSDYPHRPRSLAQVYDINVQAFRRRAPHPAAILFVLANESGKPQSVSFRLQRVRTTAVRTELASRDQAERLAILLEERRRAARSVATSSG